eukprot:CAMPEP_0116978962 /NCGR_PEP_ID=MMETSP0467-20121206/58128_1 /TAXON_ID=283647 /ORGANISM="Mesodinium pulex, Strain SPMC105" /LENGTH=40 /DNA_ID= /DNA_START= /DNA_END= /DNA_ORIENTATION=
MSSVRLEDEQYLIIPDSNGQMKFFPVKSILDSDDLKTGEE